MRIPFVDLKAQYRSIKPQIDEAIEGVIEETAFIGGKRIAAFEQAFARAHGCRHCIGVANGTDAIYVVLKMMGIGAGDEVITVANSWISTSETISQTGAAPVFVDIDETFHIDVDQIAARITERTKAILPVHLYGQPANMDALVKLCGKHNLELVEDCAQAHLSTFDGNIVGGIGRAGTFSFYPGKNLGAYGDAGAIVTNDDELAERCRMFANHGALKKHHHKLEGINSRLDGLQAAVLSAKLPHLAGWTKERQRVAAAYTEQLTGVGDLKTPIIADSRSHVFHLYVVRTSRRDELKAFLVNNDIQTGIHYPTALPLLDAYAHLGHTSADFPKAFAAQNQILSLPIFPEMSAAQIEYVCTTIRQFFDRS